MSVYGQNVQNWPKFVCENSKCVEICVGIHRIVFKKLHCVYVLAKIDKNAFLGQIALNWPTHRCLAHRLKKWETWHRLSNWASFMCINVCWTHRKCFLKKMSRHVLLKGTEPICSKILKSVILGFICVLYL